ncbi:hypothetical protein ABN028_30450 [Actinopolymorpha sp. B17G11]|uniref:hypothetical protein n=1 Tax=Actinopolymorpha sp. B17G11 TaxID=3160861 RepID=UPI0032E40A8C
MIPTAPYWQPDRAAADRAAAIAAELAPGPPGGVAVQIDITWHDTLTLVDCGANLEKISCPLCRAPIDTEWWADQIGVRHDDGYTTLVVEVPCCGGTTSLDDLDYDWPCGFARFEIAIWNPERTWFSDEELATIADALGNNVRQIRAHI